MGHVAVGLPMERVAIDVMGPLPATARKNKYLVVMADYFTKWAEAVPLADQEAATVARALVETMVCRFGAPSTLHSDQGRNFQSALFREVVRLLEMEQTRTCAFNPKSDGMVERCNRTIEALLSAVVAADQSDWDEKVPFVMAAYRASVHSTTGATPNAMMLGRETAAPLSLVYPTPEVVGEGSHGYVAKLKMNLAETHELARAHIGTSVQRQMRNHDKRAQEKVIEVGATVYYYHPLRKKGRSPKFQRYWTGPWTVIRRIGAVVYEIRRDRKSRVVHYNAIKVVPQAAGRVHRVIENGRQKGATERKRVCWADGRRGGWQLTWLKGERPGGAPDGGAGGNTVTPPGCWRVRWYPEGRGMAMGAPTGTSEAGRPEDVKMSVFRRLGGVRSLIQKKALREKPYTIPKRRRGDETSRKRDGAEARREKERGGKKLDRRADNSRSLDRRGEADKEEQPRRSRSGAGGARTSSPYRCPHGIMSSSRFPCRICGKDYARKGGLTRHQEEVHDANPTGWLCPAGCRYSRTALRWGDMARHLRRIHPDHPWLTNPSLIPKAYPIPAEGEEEDPDTPEKSKEGREPGEKEEEGNRSKNRPTKPKGVPAASTSEAGKVEKQAGEAPPAVCHHEGPRLPSVQK